MLTWMESSKSEYLTMWVATLDRFGKLVPAVAAPGGGFFFANSRIGDYSTTVLDLTNDKEDVFWSANEYIGDGGNTDLWRTHITSFTAPEQSTASNSGQ